MSYSSEVLADSPLAYYRLGDSSGTTMVDSSGNSRNGVYNNSPTLGVTGALSGDSDTAVTFNGSTQYAGTVLAAWLQPTVITVEAWIKPPDVTGSYEIVSRADNNNSTSTNNSWRLAQGTNTIQARVYVNGTSTNTAVSSSACLTAGQWHHVAFTFDGTNIVLYCNGVQVGTTARSGTLNAGTYNLSIAKSANAGTLYNPGTLDEIAIYGSVLTSTRLNAHYTAGAGTIISPPAATATAAMPAPAVTAGYTVSPPAASATASMPVPGVSADSSLSVPAATATAAAPAPLVDNTGNASVTVPASSATASMPAPGVTVSASTYIFRTPTTAIPLDPSARDFLWSRVRIQRGVTVLKLSTGAYVQQSVYDPDTADVAAIYLGGAENVVSDVEATALTAAGYGAYLTAVP